MSSNPLLHASYSNTVDKSESGVVIKWAGEPNPIELAESFSLLESIFEEGPLPQMKRKQSWASTSGRCALCLESKPLDENSHVIPHFHWKRARIGQAHGRLRKHPINPEEPEEDVREQKEHTEKMLCCDCEDKLGKWESYAARIWKRITTTANGKFTPGRNSDFLLQGIDYQKLKLYFLSLLWRMGVTGLPYFSGVTLGRKHEKNLRTMIQQERPGLPTEYPCIVSVCVITNKWRDGIMLPPERYINEEGLAELITAELSYRMMVNGVVLLFALPSFKGSMNFGQNAVDQTGTLKIFMRKMKPDEYPGNRFVQAIDAKNRRHAKPVGRIRPVR